MNFAYYVINLGLLQEQVYNQTKGRLNIPWEKMCLKRVWLLAMFSFILKFANVSVFPASSFKSNQEFAWYMKNMYRFEKIHEKE